MPRNPSRGRPPKGEHRGKSATFSTRITPELRSALEYAAETSGRSISQEVETRLRLSFDAELQRGQRDKLIEAFGGEESFALFVVLSMFIQSIEIKTGRPWHADRYTYEQVAAGAAFILDSFAPDGEPTPPEGLRWKHDTPLHLASALGVLDQIQLAQVPRKMPHVTPDGNSVTFSDQVRKAGLAKELLGALIERVEDKT